MVVSERFLARDIDFELEQNVDFCDKISLIFQYYDIDLWHSFADSHVGRLLWILDLWVYQDVFDLEKILVRDVTVPVSSNSRLGARIVSSPWPQVARKIPPVRYYSTSITLYESFLYGATTLRNKYRDKMIAYPS